MQENHDDRDQLPLVRAVYSETCERYEELMYPYALTESQGDDHEAYADLREHLAHCERCARTFHALKAMSALEESSEWPEPDELPLLSVWPKDHEADAKRPTQPPSLGYEAVQAWMDRQGQLLTRLMVDLSNLFTTLHPPMRVRDSSAPSDEPVRELLIDTTEIPIAQEIYLRISAASDRTQVDQFTLRVEITIPSQWPDFSNITVTLQLAEGQKRTQLTGQNGQAQFLALTQDEITRSTLEIKLPNP